MFVEHIAIRGTNRREAHGSRKKTCRNKSLSPQTKQRSDDGSGKDAARQRVIGIRLRAHELGGGGGGGSGVVGKAPRPRPE